MYTIFSAYLVGPGECHKLVIWLRHNARYVIMWFDCVTMLATCNWNNSNKGRRRCVLLVLFCRYNIVVTLVPGPARTRYNERRRNKEMEIHPGSIQGTLHPRFQKSGKTNNFGISRSSRIGGAGGQAHAKSRRTSTHGCQNCDVLGDRRGHSTRHRNGAVIPRRHIILAIQNRTTP